MVSGVTQSGPAIHLVVREIEARVEIRSISPSGLAILDADDAPPGTLSPLLAQTMDGSNRLRLKASGGSDPIALDVDLVWFEQAEADATGCQRVEIIIDGGGSPDWDRLLAVSRQLD